MTRLRIPQQLLYVFFFFFFCLFFMSDGDTPHHLLPQHNTHHPCMPPSRPSHTHPLMLSHALLHPPTHALARSLTPTHPRSRTLSLHSCLSSTLFFLSLFLPNSFQPFKTSWAASASLPSRRSRSRSPHRGPYPSRPLYPDRHSPDPYRGN